MIINSILENIFITPDIYGFLAGLLTTLAFFPQVIKTLKTKSAEDLSFVMLILFLIGIFFWILYGYSIHSYPIIVANVMTFALNFSILILKIIFRNN